MAFRKHFDVVVCGGGVAGCAAAIAAARRGFQTALIENTVIPGGLATSGLVLYYQALCDGEGHQILFGLSEEFFKLCNLYGPAEPPENWKEKGRLAAYFSPASFVLSLDELLAKNGVDVWFDTRIIDVRKDGCRVCAIEVANKSGRGEIEGEIFIDATGDADVVHFAGGECLTASNSLVTWVIEHRENGLSSKYTFGKDIQTLIVADPISKNSTIPGIDGRTVSDFLLRGRKRYLDILKQDYAKETETRKTRYPIALPTMVPLRHSRCVKGKFVLSGGMEWTSFSDSIGLATHWDRRGEVWEIPYRTLLPETTTGVLAAGRCSSAEGPAWEITRVIPNAAMTGEAAGAAAALSLRHGILPHELAVSILQQELREACGFPIFFQDLGLNPAKKTLHESSHQ